MISESFQDPYSVYYTDPFNALVAEGSSITSIPGRLSIDPFIKDFMVGCYTVKAMQLARMASITRNHTVAKKDNAILYYLMNSTNHDIPIKTIQQSLADL